MAVLKSPRNSRHKKRLALVFAAQNQQNAARLLPKRTLRLDHKLHLFYTNRAYYLSKLSAKRKEALESASRANRARPSDVIHYGKHRFTVSDVHPLPLRRHFRDKSSKERLFLLFNFSQAIKRSS